MSTSRRTWRPRVPKRSSNHVSTSGARLSRSLTTIIGGTSLHPARPPRVSPREPRPWPTADLPPPPAYTRAHREAMPRARSLPCCVVFLINKIRGASALWHSISLILEWIFVWIYYKMHYLVCEFKENKIADVVRIYSKY